MKPAVAVAEISRAGELDGGNGLRAMSGYGRVVLMPGMREIADALGLSLATVSRAVGGSRLVGERVRGEVRRVAEELGYVRMPRRRRRGIVNLRVVIDRPDPAGSGEFGAGLADLLAGLRQGMPGGGLNLFCDEAGPEYDPFAHKKGGDTDAFVIFQRAPDERVMELVAGRGTPLVVVNQVVTGRACVAPDHVDGMDRLVGLLADRFGELEPCFVSVDGDGWERERLEGMAGACLRRGIGFDPERDVIRGAGFREAAAAVTARCAAGTYNALVCIDDPTAVAVCGELARAGIAVGSRVAVTGFGGLPVLRLMRPALATIEVSIETLGQRAAMMIGRWLAGEAPTAGIERVAGALLSGDTVQRAAG